MGGSVSVVSSKKLNAQHTDTRNNHESSGTGTVELNYFGTCSSLDSNHRKSSLCFVDLVSLENGLNLISDINQSELSLSDKIELLTTSFIYEESFVKDDWYIFFINLTWKLLKSKLSVLWRYIYLRELIQNQLGLNTNNSFTVYDISYAFKNTDEIFWSRGRLKTYLEKVIFESAEYSLSYQGVLMKQRISDQVIYEAYFTDKSLSFGDKTASASTEQITQ